MSIQLSKIFLERIYKAYSVAALTGAGISAASGIPTFRGKDGLWNKYHPHELASMEAFMRQPEVVWEWYRWRRNIARNAQPNQGHTALADISRCFPEFSVITQNVDNLHRRAGSGNITELHGNIFINKCIDCTYEAPAGEDADSRKIPLCPSCGGWLRPGVVWFGEMMPVAELAEAQRLATEAEVFFSIGTSSLVEPAASLPYLAKANGAFVVEINPEETPLSQVADERFPFDVVKFLPALAQIVLKLRKGKV